MVGVPGKGKSAYVEPRHSKSELLRSIAIEKGWPIVELKLNGDVVHTDHVEELIELLKR